jgi:uncharacterized protein involved in exopolysaccharide biosynthesis
VRWTELVAAVVARRKLIYAIVGTTTFLAVAVSLLLSNRYTARAIILPSGERSNLQKLAGLAGGSLLGLGIDPSAVGIENSSLLFPDVLKSRTVREGVLTATYRFPQGKRVSATTLLEHFGVRSLDRGVKRLKNITDIAMNPKTGVIALEVTTGNPELSAAVANEFIHQLDRYNQETRLSKAKDNEAFIARRLEEVQGELRTAEDNLEKFQSQNRNYYAALAPDLTKELKRLQREVEVKNQVFLTLTQQHELAKIEAKRDLPIVQVLDYARPPEVKSFPQRSFIVLAAFTLSLAFSIFWALWSAYLRHQLSDEERDRLRQQFQAFAADRRRLWQFVRRPHPKFEVPAS